MSQEETKPREKHVWYFCDVDKFAIVGDNQHWYWIWFCSVPIHIIYLGEL